MQTGHARSHDISVEIKMSAPLFLTSRSQAADITKFLHAFSVAEFFQNQLFQKILSEICNQGVKHIGSKSGLTFCQA